MKSFSRIKQVTEKAPCASLLGHLIARIDRNKGEARKAQARAVSSNRLGELRDRTYDHQRDCASRLTPVVAAIVLWNTMYIERAVKPWRWRAQAIPLPGKCKYLHYYLLIKGWLFAREGSSYLLLAKVLDA